MIFPIVSVSVSEDELLDMKEVGRHSDGALTILEYYGTSQDGNTQVEMWLVEELQVLSLVRSTMFIPDAGVMSMFETRLIDIRQAEPPVGKTELPAGYSIELLPALPKPGEAEDSP